MHILYSTNYSKMIIFPHFLVLVIGDSEIKDGNCPQGADFRGARAFIKQIIQSQMPSYLV